MSMGVVLTLAIVVFVASFAQGTTGLGFAMISAPVIGFAEPRLLPVFLLVLMIPLNLYIAWRERRALDRHGAGWITVGRFAGTFGGLAVLATIPAAELKLLIGGATVIAAVATLLAPSFTPTTRVFAVSGVVTGVMETATGIGGPPLALVYQHRPAPVLRSTVAVCFVVGEVISLILLFASGQATSHQFFSAIWFIPALVLGALLSRWVHHRVDGRKMRMVVLAFAIVSGAVLVLSR